MNDGRRRNAAKIPVSSESGVGGVDGTASVGALLFADLKDVRRRRVPKMPPPEFSSGFAPVGVSVSWRLPPLDAEIDRIALATNVSVSGCGDGDPVDELVIRATRGGLLRPDSGVPKSRIISPFAGVGDE